MPRTLFAVARIFIALILSFLSVTLLGPASASAAETRGGDTPAVAASEQIDGDLYLSGREATVDGIVRGDLIVVAGTLRITGRVEGSVNAVARRIEIGGAIARSLRAVAGEVTISGPVAGDVVLIAGDLTLLASGSIGGDLLIRGGDVEVRGPVVGDIRGRAGGLTISSDIGGDVDVSADRVRLGRNASITGNLAYRSPDEATVAPGATVAGTTTWDERSRFDPGRNPFEWFGQPFFGLLSALVAGLVLITLMPRLTVAVADGARRGFAVALLLGVLLLAIIPIVCLALAATIVGLPIALVGVALLAVLLYLSQVFVGLALGRAVLPKRWDTVGRGYNILAMTLGMIAIAGIKLLPAPYLGLAVGVVVAALGVGGAARARLVQNAG